MTQTQEPIWRFTDEESEQLVALWIGMMRRAETAEDELNGLVEFISIPITYMFRSGFANSISKETMLEGLMHYQKLFNDTILYHAENLMTGRILKKDLH